MSDDLDRYLQEILAPYAREDAAPEPNPTPSVSPLEATARKPWLFDFCHDTAQMNLEYHEHEIEPEVHGEMCAFFEEAVGDCSFRGTMQWLGLVLAPRGTFKTSIGVEALVLGVLTKNPDARILIVGPKQKSAAKRLKAIKRHITHNVDFQDTYGYDWKPGFQQGLWSDYQIEITRRTVQHREPSVGTASVGIDVTGDHYDLIIADDLVTEDNVKSTDSRDQVGNYIDALLPVLNPGGTLLLVGTRWHPDDVYGRMLKRDADRVREGKAPLFKTFIRSCWDGPTGLFFPKKLTHEYLAEKKAINSHQFAAYYENKPVADEDKVFDLSLYKELDFAFYDDQGVSIVDAGGLGKLPVMNTLSWDPAGRRPTGTSDFHGLTLVGTDPYGRWWVPHCKGFKGRPSDVMDHVCGLIEEYKPWRIIVENNGVGAMWIEMLERELIVRGLMIEVLEDTGGGQSKNARIAALEPAYKRRTIFFAPGFSALKSQMDSFSVNGSLAHEDELDSLAKHVGRTVASEERIIRQKAPLDPEYLARKKRIEADERNERRERQRLWDQGPPQW